MSGAVKLLPCPFCRSKDIDHKYVGHIASRFFLRGNCRDCGASGPMDDPDGTLWNTRVPDPAVAVLEAEVARLREMLSEARFYVTDALEAYEHTDGRDLLNRIDATLNPAPSEKEAG